MFAGSLAGGNVDESILVSCTSPIDEPFTLLRGRVPVERWDVRHAETRHRRLVAVCK